MHIFAPAAVMSLTAPGRAPPWPSLVEGLPTGRYGAHTGSRTTSAPRRNSARPVEESGGRKGRWFADEDILWYGYWQWSKNRERGKNRGRVRESKGERENMKERKERDRDRGRSVNARMSQWSRHLHSAPGFLPPAGTLDCFKVLNWRTHHNRHTPAHTLTRSHVQKERRSDRENVSEESEPRQVSVRGKKDRQSWWRKRDYYPGILQYCWKGHGRINSLNLSLLRISHV